MLEEEWQQAQAQAIANHNAAAAIHNAEWFQHLEAVYSTRKGKSYYPCAYVDVCLVKHSEFFSSYR